jgi:hypothetical protein
MTMVSFRVADTEAAEMQQWADHLGVDRSELLREALHRHLVALRSERESERYDELPPSASELAVGENAEWGPAEDWSDWSDSTSDATR